MIFAGQSSSGGHEFVIDGYDGSDMFHVNWGWAGKNDGYFAINVLNPNDNTSMGSASSTDLGFATNQEIILGMEKSTGQEAEVPEIVKQLIIYNELIAVDTIMAYQAAYTDFNLEETSYYMGLGIRNADGTCTAVLQNDTTTKYFNGYISGQIFKTQKLSLADGSYTLYPIAREAGDATEKWQAFSAQGQCFYVDVKDAKATVRPLMKLKITDAFFETEPTPLEQNTLVVVVENQGEQDVSTVTKLRVGKTNEGKFLSTLEVKNTMRPTELRPGERTTLRYPMIVPCKGDLEVNLLNYTELVTLNDTIVSVENSPHFFDLQLVDYKIEYPDSLTLNAMFYVKNNDTRTWENPFNRKQCFGQGIPADLPRINGEWDYRTINRDVMVDTKEQYETVPALQEAVQYSIGHQFMVAQEETIDQPAAGESHTHYITSAKRTFEAAKEYIGKKTAVLNFANNHSVGGAPFTAGAQEESLCRCSTLYPCLQAMYGQFYKKH